MITGWTSEYAARTSRHVKEVLVPGFPGSGGEVEAARHTHCLPVYADLSGFIVLSSEGELFFYNPEIQTVSPLQETLWEKVAMVSLAKRYPDLSELLPARSPHAPICPNCNGSGRVMNERLFCSTCGGYGWIDN